MKCLNIRIYLAICRRHQVFSKQLGREGKTPWNPCWVSCRISVEHNLWQQHEDKTLSAPQGHLDLWLRSLQGQQGLSLPWGLSHLHKYRALQLYPYNMIKNTVTPLLSFILQQPKSTHHIWRFNLYQKKADTQFFWIMTWWTAVMSRERLYARLSWYLPLSQFMACWPSLQMWADSSIHLLGRFGFLSIIIAFTQLITWFSWIAYQWERTCYVLKGWQCADFW